MSRYLIFYFSAVNIVSLIICGYDKICAIKKQYRVSEKTLFLLSAFGGSVGMYLGMILFRHKTKHLKFTLGIPAIVILQVVILFFIVKAV